MMITDAVLETSEKFKILSLETRKQAIDKARGYRRIAMRATTLLDRMAYMDLARKAVKHARAANKALISNKRFERLVTRVSK